MHHTQRVGTVFIVDVMTATTNLFVVAFKAVKHCTSTHIVYLDERCRSSVVIISLWKPVLSNLQQHMP